jgi:hypothetical protein
MSGLGTAATTLITTGGLYIDDGIVSILNFGGSVTPWIQLYINDYVPPLADNYVAAVGSRVYAPGEIANLYMPIDPNTGVRSPEPFLVPMDKEADYFRKNKVITLKINFAGKQYENHYAVPEQQAKRIVEIANFVNATRSKINVSVSNIKKLATTALVEVRNFKFTRKPK